MIHIIFGPSGSGKTNLCQQLRELNRIFGSVSLHAKMTTRRKKDYDGNEIVPCSREELYNKCGGTHGYIYESSDYCGNTYEFGISKEEINCAIRKGDEHFIICNNFTVAQTIRRDFMGYVPVRIVYLMYNAKKEEIIKQIKNKLAQECDIYGNYIPEEKYEECANTRYGKILSIREEFNENVSEFDGVIFNQFAQGANATEALLKLRLQIEREIHLEKGLAWLKEKDCLSTQKTHSKIFISHSSGDKNYVNAFVKLIETIELPRDSIFYSSNPSYGIRNGSPIYSEIISCLQNDVKLVILISSENFYRSPGCLIELGATWALNLANTNIGLPNWDLSKGIGPADLHHMSILLDNHDDANIRLDELRSTIVKIFGLNKDGDDEKWSESKKEFFKTIRKIRLKKASIIKN